MNINLHPNTKSIPQFKFPEQQSSDVSTKWSHVHTLNNAPYDLDL